MEIKKEIKRPIKPESGILRFLAFVIFQADNIIMTLNVASEVIRLRR